MINLLSEQITNIYMNDVECLGKNEYLKIKYGMELLLSTIAMVIVLGIVGAITKSGKDIFIFSASFCTLRLFSGGWHAKSHYKCIFVFVAVNLIVSFYLIKIINHIHMIFEPLFMGMMFMSILIVWIKAPVDSKEKRLNEIEKSRYRFFARMVVVTEAIMATILFKFSAETASAISLGIWIQAVTMIRKE